MGDDFTEWTGNKGAAPELELPFPSHPIDHGHIYPVGYSVSPLDQLPGAALDAEGPPAEVMADDP